MLFDPFTIRTSCGLQLSYLTPQPRVIRLEDIAYGLAGIQRWNAQAKPRITVAEHALSVSSWLRLVGQPKRVQLLGLHHDDSEAYAGDQPTPLKNLIHDLREVHHRLQRAIFQSLGISPPTPQEAMWVKTADVAVGVAEAKHSMGISAEELGITSSFPLVKMTLWAGECSTSTMGHFLGRHHELTKKEN